MVWSGGQGGFFLDWEKLDAAEEAEEERMKKEMMDVEALSRAELLTLLSILEGELEAQDVVIHSLRAQHRDAFVQERYGQYDLSDPFLALQRDSAVEERHAHQPGATQGPNPLAVLKLVMAHCKRMQERMMGQLTAAESRHRRVIVDLEEEKRRRAQDVAQGDDITSMLQSERDKLLQQLESEHAAVQRLHQEHAAASDRAEESLSRQREVHEGLTLELQEATGQLREEAQRTAQLTARLQEESDALESLRGALEGETGRAAGLEARAERQLAERDTEREQMKLRLRREQERSGELERHVEELRRRLGEEGGGDKEGGATKETTAKEVKESPTKTTTTTPAAPASASSPAPKTEPDLKGASSAHKTTSQSPKVNGHAPHHHAPKDTTAPPRGAAENNHHAPKDTTAPPQDGRRAAENGGGGMMENGVGGAAAMLHSPPPPPLLSHPQSPSSTASSSLSSSPISSPVLAKRLGSPLSSYQAGINQRFHAARHKFQTQAELEQQAPPLSPRDLSPTATPPVAPPTPPPPENSTAKQLARNTVTQVLSRFTSQQAGVKQLAPISSSPFGTDYRNVASPPPPTTGGRSPSSGGPLSPGLSAVRSPLTPRSERSLLHSQSHPPVPAKKPPGMSPTPGSPGVVGGAASSVSRFPELTGSCGGHGGVGSNGQEGGAKEPDLLLSSS